MKYLYTPKLANIKGDTVIGGMEWIILILVVVLLLFGAKKIPEFARSLGKAKAEFQRGQLEIEREIRDERERYENEKSKSKTATYDMRSPKVVKAAEALGIETRGKTESQLKKEIAAKMA